MEALFYLFLAFIGYYVVFRIIGSGVRAAGRGIKKVVTGKETYHGPPQVKFIDEKVEGSDVVFKKVMYRGRIPVSRPMTVRYCVSAFDVTEGDDDASFIIAMIEQQQEAETVCFGISSEIGDVDVGDTFTDWIQLGAISPEYIQVAKSGNRTVKLVIRLYNAHNPPGIRAGFSDGEGEVIFTENLEFDHFFSDKGYEEAASDREEAQALSLKIGVAVAMADGTLDDSEGEILKGWIVREVSAFSDEKSKRLKKHFNEALKEGFSLAQSGNLALSPLVERLSEIGEKKTKYDALELAFDVMAADGVADPEEMAVIRNVAKALDLDMDEIEKMREGVTLSLSVALTSDVGLESLVGIEEGWSDGQKKKHLRSEFQKWSNRLNSLPEGEDREAAQNMLDNIASLRKKYG
jgi:tellurite resistance protein